ncbi:MAG: T9SS type A sorting domain-containing protein [Crocinitomicaceae bacterium]
MGRAFFILIILIGFTSFSQNESVVGYFNATELNGRILLTWNIKQGNTCNGVKVEHSIDSLNFSEIGSIEGVCGSNTANVAYEFTHQNPTLNAVNYYRLLMGGIGYSWVISEKIIAIDDLGYTIAPQPVTNQSILYFENPNNKEYKLSVANLSGKVVYAESLLNEQLSLGELGFESGYYFFELQEVGTSTNVRGKFIVP